MILVTRHCCRPQGPVWVDKHFHQKSQVMATLGMAKFGPDIQVGAWKAARFNMTVSIRQQTGFNRLSVVATFKAATRSASGVAMDFELQYMYLRYHPPSSTLLADRR